MLWQPARARAAAAKAILPGAALLISCRTCSPQRAWDRQCPCSSCSSPPPCRRPSSSTRSPWPWQRPPFPPKRIFRRRSWPAPPAAWRAMPRQLRSAAPPRERRQFPFSSWSPPPPSMLDLRRSAGLGSDLARLDLVVPELVVLLGPRLVGDPVAHVAVGALDADRAHVDMAERHGDHRHRGDDVDDVHLLHRGAQLLEIRKQHHESGHRRDEAEDHHAGPEVDLLAGIEAARRQMYADQDLPAVREPRAIALRWQVVPGVDDDHAQQADEEQRADQIMQVL